MTPQHTALIALIGYIVFLLIITKGHPIQYIKSIIQQSQNAPEKHWGTFALLMGGVILFVIVLIAL